MDTTETNAKEELKMEKNANGSTLELRSMSTIIRPVHLPPMVSQSHVNKSRVEGDACTRENQVAIRQFHSGLSSSHADLEATEALSVASMTNEMMKKPATLLHM